MIKKSEDAINEIIRVEGGYSNDPSDSGGETKYGITKAVAESFGLTKPVKSLTKDDARLIYKSMYWDSLRLNEISEINEDLAFELFDTGVNLGIGASAKFLQRCLNVLNNKQEFYNDIKIDGAVGNNTVLTLQTFYKKRGDEGIDVLVNMLNCLQGAFYVELCERREKDEKYIYGWMVNRVSNT